MSVCAINLLIAVTLGGAYEAKRLR